MTRRRRIEVEVEMIDGPVPFFHVKHYARFTDLYIYRDGNGCLRAVTPRHGLPTPVMDEWHDGWPPLAAIIDDAFPGARHAEAA